jgi:hypothetical protein
MQTWVYQNKEGVNYIVVHRNTNLLIWDHPYLERGSCPACLGTSEAAPKAPAATSDLDDTGRR